MRLIPDFIEAGVKVLDPIQVTARGMDIRQLKNDFGKQVTFHGGIDVQRNDIKFDDVSKRNT